jgi:hypothetical protein
MLKRTKFVRREVLNRLQGNYYSLLPLCCEALYKAPTALKVEKAYAKLGRLKGTEHRGFYLNYGGSEVFAQSMATRYADPYTFAGHRHAKSLTSETASVRN